MFIRLCPRTEDHVRIYFARTCDPELEAMLPRSVHSLAQALENFRKSQQPDANSFGRTIYCGGQYVGDVWCYGIDSAQSPQAMLSYCIFDKALWGQGVGTQAVALFLQELTERFGLTSVGAFAYCANQASLRVLEKNGFQLEETFVEDGIQSAFFRWNCPEKVEFPFSDQFHILKGRGVTLQLLEQHPADGPVQPFYWYQILEGETPVGKISLRLGLNRHTYYNGHIGYEIDPPSRGRHLAFHACQALLPLARFHGMKELLLTCREHNVPSYRTIERLGGELLEVCSPPEDYAWYRPDLGRCRIYQLTV